MLDEYRFSQVPQRQEVLRSPQFAGSHFGACVWCGVKMDLKVLTGSALVCLLLPAQGRNMVSRGQLNSIF